MTRKVFSIVISIVIAIAAMTTIFGCSSPSSPEETKPEPRSIVGYWEVAGGVIEGDEITSDQIEMMKQAGLTISCEFTEDSKITMSEFGSVILTGTWEEVDESNVTIKSDAGGKVSATFQDDTHIVLKVDEDALLFEKTDKENATQTDTVVASAVQDAINENRANANQSTANSDQPTNANRSENANEQN